MFVRQCLSCGVIDGRQTLPDEQSGLREQRPCEHCGGSEFEVVAMVEDEPTASLDDEYE